MRAHMPIAAILAASIFTPPAVAQNTALTETNVRDFLKNMSAQAQDAVRKEDWDGVRAWTGQHFAEQAQFAVKGSMISSTGAVFTYSGTMGRRDVDAITSKMLSLRGLLQSLKDYRLETEVQSVSILPNGEATALVLFRETAGLDPSQLAAAGQPSGQSNQEGRAASADQTQRDTQGSGLVFQSSSRCDMRMASRAERIEIRIAACDTTTTF